MSLTDALALFGVMLVLAALPSLSVLLVATRAASLGLAHGLAAAVGVVFGDLVLVAMAVFGLVVLAETMGEWFQWVKYGAGLYLFWLGVGMWRQASGGPSPAEARGRSLRDSVTAGLLLTLSDQKAVVFYFAFLPAFVELGALTWKELALIAAITVTAVGGVKSGYACAAARGGSMVGGYRSVWLNRGAGAMLGLAGVAVWLRA